MSKVETVEPEQLLSGVRSMSQKVVQTVETGAEGEVLPLSQMKV